MPTIGDWSTAELARFVAAQLKAPSSSFFRSLVLETFTVTKKLVVTGDVEFSQQATNGDGWHYVGQPGEPAFLGTWANYPAPYGGARFRKLVSGLVVMDGLIQSGTVATAAFVLPPGYRPAKGANGAARVHIFTAAQGGVPANMESIRIDTGSGTYTTWGVTPSTAGTPTWVSLNGIQFFAEN